MSISFEVPSPVRFESKERSVQAPETVTILTKTGLCFSRHAAHRALTRHVPECAIADALEHPLKEGEVTVDEFGRPALRIVGKKAEVVLNPETGVIVSVNQTKPSKVRALAATHFKSDLNPRR